MNLLILLQARDNLITYIGLHPILCDIIRILGHSCKGDILGVAIWIPVRIDIQPRIEGWEDADTSDDYEHEETP